MDENQMRELVASMVPGRSICITRQIWRHVRPDGTQYDREDWAISVLPSICGTRTCDRFDGRCYADAEAKLRAHIANVCGALVAPAPEPSLFGILLAAEEANNDEDGCDLGNAATICRDA